MKIFVKNCKKGVDNQSLLCYYTIRKRQEDKKMDEFKMFKTILERLGHTLNIEKWNYLDEIWIEDKTTDVTYEFVSNKLTYVWNEKNN